MTVARKTTTLAERAETVLVGAVSTASAAGASASAGQEPPVLSMGRFPEEHVTLLPVSPDSMRPFKYGGR
jgi:hypothetical protein